MSVKFTANFDSFNDAMGRIVGVSREVESGYYAATIVELTHAVASREFDVAANAAYMSNPDGYKHVYDWEPEVGGGLTANKLWRHTLSGNGNSGIRTAGFRFVNSRKPVPKYDGPGSDQLSDRKYIFAAKATVMEYGLPVTIASKDGAGWLFVPVPEDSQADIHGQGYIFTKGPITVHNPGGPVAGNFTAFWEGWWASQGQTIHDRKIAPRVEGRLRKFVTPRRGLVAPRSGNVGARRVQLSATAMSQAMREVRADAERMRQEARAIKGVDDG